MKSKRSFFIGLAIVLLIQPVCAQDNALSDDGFETIFNGENWDGWHLKLRNGDEELAKEVFTIEDGMVHVFKYLKDSTDLNTGVNATHGLFYTNKSYSKYILRFEYKWGHKITNNFDSQQFDAGVYYNVSNDKVWPLGVEYQIRYDSFEKTNHTGDLIRPGGAAYDWYANADTKRYQPKKDGGKLFEGKGWLHMAKSTTNFNGDNDEWNSCEIIVMGDQYSIHKLNGDIVNVAYNLSPKEGIFGFQSETAEIFYKNIRIKEFDEIIPIEKFLSE